MSDTPVIFCNICRDIHVEGKHLTLEEIQKRYLLQVYEATGRNKTQTAKILRINQRTVRRLIHNYT